NTEIVAKVEDMIVGTKLKKGKGSAYYCGFRPRDDQSSSLGYESRTLFEILNIINAYPSSGRYAVNDNPAYVSRTTDFFATKFPNGTTAIVKHYRTHRENWQGGFSRNEEADAQSLAANPMPSDRLDIRDLKINGHNISYDGKMNVAFRTDNAGKLIAFNGDECTGITIDGINYKFSDNPVKIAYVPQDKNLKTYTLQLLGEGKVTLPLPAAVTSAIVKYGKTTIASTLKDGNLILNIDNKLSGKWLDIIYK
ncbi:MAG: hypothetical protein LBJ72_01350, partial [Dysgonamonadaceae bacterium]|nr:hypothetical protein [Dysgonamonadaceae bacterium]